MTITNLEEHDVIQFNENHKWCGCFGYISEIRPEGRITVAIPIPSKGTSFIFCKRSDFDVIGKTNLVLPMGVE